VLARLLIAAALIVAFPAAASADSYFPVRGAPAPGPSKYDKVWVQQIGPSAADHVLVLVAGSQGAAGSMTLMARDVQAALGSGWQIWIFDRREVAFNDLTGFKSGRADAAKDYYLGFKYRQVHTKDVPFARKWGMAVQMNDLHRVVRKAAAGGRKVVLGGHSFGAAAAISYAAWDFNGRAGYKDLDGVVLIDGGELGSFTGAGRGVTLAQAKKEKAKIDKGEAFDDLLGIGNPSIPEIFAEIAALYALEDPGGTSVLQPNPLVPASLRPPFTVTNGAFLGNILDKETALAPSLAVRAGTFATEGDPRPWVDGENMTIKRLATAFAQLTPQFAEWYYPSRLGLDSLGANSMKRDAVTKFLGLRLWHTKGINVPLFVYQTDLTAGGVIRGARAVQKASKIPRLVEVDDSAAASHLDPVIAPPEFNGFTQNVVPFLKSLG
jgi:pimeloyl-ACP methyl ester carboxylesterase